MLNAMLNAFKFICFMQRNLGFFNILLFILAMKVYLHAYTILFVILLCTTALSIHILLGVPGAISLN